MSKEKQMVNDLIEIFDEEYGKRYFLTPQNTAEKLMQKGYRKATDVAEEIFAELKKAMIDEYRYPIIAELKKKYGVE